MENHMEHEIEYIRALSQQLIATLGPKANEYYPHWVIWSPSTLIVTADTCHL